MEYKHGERLTPLIHEMTPLEAAIERFSQQAQAYYSKNKDLTTPEHAKRNGKRFSI